MDESSKKEYLNSIEKLKNCNAVCHCQTQGDRNQNNPIEKSFHPIPSLPKPKKEIDLTGVAVAKKRYDGISPLTSALLRMIINYSD